MKDPNWPIAAAVLGVLLAAHLCPAAQTPPTTSLSVASLSIVPKKWDKQANAEKIETMVRQAAELGAKLVITPEGALEGYVVNDVIRESDEKKKTRLTETFRALAEPLDGPYMVRFRRLADELDIHLILGFLEKDGIRTFNSAALIGPQGHLIGTYHKTHFHQGYQVNPPGYTPGDEYPVFDIGALRVGIMICFDRQLPEPARQLALAGADLIACPSFGGRGDWNTRIMQVRAYENHCYVIFTHPQQSLILSRDGVLLAECQQDAIAIGKLDVSDLGKSRPSVIHRRPETYRPGNTR